MANEHGNNGSETRSGESPAEGGAIAEQVKVLTEQVLASQQAQVAMQQTQQSMMEILRTLQQTVMATHAPAPAPAPAAPSSTLEGLNLVTPQNLGRQGVSQALLAQVNPTALNFTPLQTQPQAPTNTTQNTPRLGTTPPIDPSSSQASLPSAMPQSQTQTPLLTLDQLKSHVRELVQQESGVGQAELDLDLRPPYPVEIARMPYPEGYVVPKFIKFDGKRGNAREHVVRFIDSLGVYGQDRNLRVKEFSKSLTHKAYTWYANLPVGSVGSWDDLVRKFHTKFFYVEERLTALHLMRETQRAGEDLLDYVRRFKEKALDIQDPLSEDQMVKICIEGMHTSPRIHLVNHQFHDFSGLCLAARNLSETVKGARRTFNIPSGPQDKQT